ncbi:MAG: hypothetical protein QOH46_4141 [Solirubrobacteraceae bacterium]|nr:hypothetical protein [Solirubrobacteraceae bacterium]
MGVIYRATELRLGRPVALKLIAAAGASDPALRERFEREARLTASIDHPNVIPVYAAGEEDGHLYLVMRYVPGTDLHALLRREGRLAPARAARVVAQVADALDAAHAAGLVHRDVKPANVLIAGEHVYLSDFGITRIEATDTRITESGGWVGTVDYMAPEHLRDDATDARSDVYALGCVLYTTLTGTPPFRRPTVAATITAHLHEAAPRPSATPGVPAAFDAVVARALAKDPSDRHPSAGDLGRAALAAVAGDLEVVPRGSVARGEAAAGEGPQTAVTRVAGDGEAATAVAPPTAPATERPPGPAPPARPRPSHERPAAVRPQRSRRRTLVIALTSLVLALPAAAVIAVVLSSGGAPAGPLSAGEVGDVARAFAKAYANEDTSSLRRLLTPGVRRVGTVDVQRGRAAVVGEYRRQFATDTVQSYTLAGLRTDGGAVGRAEGRYTVTRGGRPPLAGHLVLGVVRRDGEPRIDLIATEPRG